MHMLVSKQTYKYTANAIIVPARHSKPSAPTVTSIWFTLRTVCLRHGRILHLRHANTVVDTFSLIAMICILIAPSPVVFLVLGICVVAVQVFHNIHHPIWQHLTQLSSHIRRSIQPHFVETATGSVHIRALAWELKHALKNRRLLDRDRQIHSRFESLQRWSMLTADLICVSLCVGFMLAGLQGSMELERVGLAFTLLFTGVSLLPSLMVALNEMRNVLSILQQTEDFIESIPREERAVTKPLPKSFEVQGEIQLRRASFGYQSDEPLSLTRPY